MKTKIFFLIFFLTLTIKYCISQIYNPIPDSNVVWSVDSVKFTFSGDTIIGGITYTKYYKQSGDSIFDFSKCQYYAAVRENNEKIFGIKANDSVEKLLYDYSAEIGNIVTVHYFYSYYNDLSDSAQLQVTNIDSVLTGDYYSKRITLMGANMHMDEIWIEGIGSNYGFFSSGFGDYHIFDVFYPRLLCYEKNGELLYSYYIIPDCYEIQKNMSISKTNILENHVQIYPNPATDLVNIIFESINHDFKTIEVYNYMGQLLLQLYCENKTKVLINIQDLNKGLYIINITGSNAKIKKTLTIN